MLKVDDCAPAGDCPCPADGQSVNGRRRFERHRLVRHDVAVGGSALRSMTYLFAPFTLSHLKSISPSWSPAMALSGAGAVSVGVARSGLSEGVSSCTICSIP